MEISPPLPIVRYVFYAFIFTIPIETVDIGVERGLLSITSLVGYLFMAVALLQPRATFGMLPKPFWYFSAYLLVFVCRSISEKPVVWPQFFTLLQMLVLFWICSNLFEHQRLIKGVFLSLGAGCVLVSILQIEGSAAMAVGPGRVTAMSQDPNTLASVLSLGLISLLGLSYGRASQDRRLGLLAWMGFGSLSAGIVLTASRGALLSLLAGIMCFITRPGHFGSRLKIGFITILTLCCLVWIAYQNDAVRIRWERTFLQGNMAGREKIMPVAWGMFIEAPIVGWGPGNNTLELGRRFGYQFLDTHNGYLWILTETGLVGAVPYFIALWLCCRAAWRARLGPEGSLPLALLMCVLFVNMSVTWHYRKLFWIVLAYSIASEVDTRSRAVDKRPIQHIR